MNFGHLTHYYLINHSIFHIAVSILTTSPFVGGGESGSITSRLGHRRAGGRKESGGDLSGGFGSLGSCCCHEKLQANVEGVSWRKAGHGHSIAV